MTRIEAPSRNRTERSPRRKYDPKSNHYEWKHRKRRHPKRNQAKRGDSKGRHAKRNDPKRKPARRSRPEKKHPKMDKREPKGPENPAWLGLAQNCLPNSSSSMRLLFEFNKVPAVVDSNRGKFAHQVCADKAVKAHFFLWDDEADTWRAVIAGKSEFALRATR